MRYGILSEKRSLKMDLGSNPFALAVRRIQRVVMSATAAELRTKFSALDLIELLNLAPSLVADGSRHIDFQSYDGHKMKPIHHRDIESQRKSLISFALVFLRVSVPPW